MGGKLGQLEACLEIPVMRCHISFLRRYQTGRYWFCLQVPRGEFPCALVLQTPRGHCRIGTAAWEEYRLWINGLGSDGADGHQVWVTPAGLACSVWTVINLLLCAVSNFSSSGFVTSCHVSRDRIDSGKDISVIFPLTVQLRNLAFLTWVKDKKNEEVYTFTHNMLHTATSR